MILNFVDYSFCNIKVAITVLALCFSNTYKVNAHEVDTFAEGVSQVAVPSFADRIFAVKSGSPRKQIQKTIDACSKAGGGKVKFERGTYNLDGSIELKSGVCLVLDDGVELKFSSNPDDYLPVVPSRWEGTELYGRRSMIHAERQTYIGIVSNNAGVIDAQGYEMARWGIPDGKPFYEFDENTHGTHGDTPEKADVERLRKMGEELTPVGKRVFGKGTHLRPCAIEFNSCSKVLIQGIVLRNSPFWCIHPLYCEDVTVRGVKIESCFPNNDGCDPESSRRVLIEDCVFNTGDDAIAIKSGRDADGRRVGKPSEQIYIRNCKFMSKCNGLCIGSEMSGGVKNVFMKNVEIGSVKNALLFKSNLDRGGYIDNIYVDSVNIEGAAGAVLRFETNYFGYRGGNYPAQYSNFYINNVHAGKADAYAIYYDGNTAAPITNIRVNDFVVDKALHAYYLFKTKDCSFVGCKVNGEALPEHPVEDSERRQCDVW